MRKLFEDLARDYHEAGLCPEDILLLEYAAKLTQTPSLIEEADIKGLRDAGFDDRDIHDACAITAYFAFVNRIASGLGVELESPK